MQPLAAGDTLNSEVVKDWVRSQARGQSFGWSCEASQNRQFTPNAKAKRGRLENLKVLGSTFANKKTFTFRGTMHGSFACSVYTICAIELVWASLVPIVSYFVFCECSYCINMQLQQIFCMVLVEQQAI